jgi:hypothetical protein
MGSIILEKQIAYTFKVVTCALKMQALCFSVTSMPTYLTAWCRYLKNHNTKHICSLPFSLTIGLYSDINIFLSTAWHKLILDQDCQNEQFCLFTRFTPILR